ncbi:MAG: integration host factor subunit alpha [Robiginitomaculum sp.]|nr:MAG: integration host factor subunit alpha [Robiginitomaculum sp.]
MSEYTVTRADLTEAIYREIGLSRTESAVLVESILNHIVKALIKGESVKLSGFGTFSVRDKRERMGRNPKTGREVPITKRRVLVFKPSNVLKERVNVALTGK